MGNSCYLVRVIVTLNDNLTINCSQNKQPEPIGLICYFVDSYLLDGCFVGTHLDDSGVCPDAAESLPVLEKPTASLLLVRPLTVVVQVVLVHLHLQLGQTDGHHILVLWRQERCQHVVVKPLQYDN